jgi:hypothetical protein
MLINGIECPKFTLEEFACKCGCGLANPAHSLLDRLNESRAESGISYTITSGGRCIEHNRAEGGNDSSSHLPSQNGYTYAVDIAATTSSQRSAILRGLHFAGFNRIGIAKTFIHADVDLLKNDNVCWLYT